MDKKTTEQKLAQMQAEILQKKQQREAPEIKASRSGKKRRLLGQLAFLVLVLLLLAALVSIQMQRRRGEIPQIMGIQIYKVETGSMTPTLPVGSVFIARKVKSKETFSSGDIVTFRTLSGAIVTHRIIEVTTLDDQLAYRTKGDNPISSPDQELLTPDRIVSKFVAKMPMT